MKYAFNLPGGAFRGAVQVGFIKRWLKLGLGIDFVAGTSVGALIGALVAMKKFDLLFEMWDAVGETNGAVISKAYLAEFHEGGMKINTDNIEDVLMAGITFGDKVALITKKGRNKFIKKVVQNGENIEKLMDNSPLIDILIANVRKADFVIPYRCQLVSLYDGALYKPWYTDFKTDRDLALGIAASSTMPGFWAPIPRIQLADGQVIKDAVDGGLRMNSPLPVTFDSITFDPWSIISINPNNLQQMVNEKKKNIVVQAGTTVDILLNNGLEWNIKMSQKINDWATKYEDFRVGEQIKIAKLYDIQPPVNEFGENALGRSLDPRPEWIKKRIDIGYSCIDPFLNEIKKNDPASFN